MMIDEYALDEINALWDPVRPYLARQIEDLYGRSNGHVLEIGPFSGLVFALAEKGVGQSFMIAAFPGHAAESCRKKAVKLGLEDTVRVIESDPLLTGVPDESVDLAIFRGALFFPSVFHTEFAAVYRTLRSGGLAFVGGGYGRSTPQIVIDGIGERSKTLNFEMGKVRVTEESVHAELTRLGLDGKAEIIAEGGLWVVLRK